MKNGSWLEDDPAFLLARSLFQGRIVRLRALVSFLLFEDFVQLQISLVE